MRSPIFPSYPLPESHVDPEEAIAVVAAVAVEVKACRANTMAAFSRRDMAGWYRQTWFNQTTVRTIGRVREAVKT